MCIQETKHLLHPEAHIAHKAMLAQWLLGAAIEEYNPCQGEWRENPKPTFDPLIRYRLKIIPSNNPLHFEPAHQFERGQIWITHEGKRYLVLANTSAIPFPNAQHNPDFGNVVVMRYEDGKPQDVSTRDSFGNTQDGSKEFKLIRCIGHSDGLNDFADYVQDFANEVTIYLREDGCAIRLCKSTGEVKLN